ncbi:putative quinol monooxygenase [Capnocytophaga ochracea]|uniref:Antibiotic biosynthesis monooxygenase n=1 Tax=Capnocytophaga ochracea TaxID=1018 RepID=A0A2X2SNT1_CAPOC|nr:antibiotic biosynthesis monooxygenase family protein [Capnocytophaga ochracea]SQA94766.1 Antibiotic biosynthesis monooxygenase [Capnocytophaga ochracea]
MKRIFLTFIVIISCLTTQAQNREKMKIRLAEINIVPEYREEYLKRAEKVGALSVEKEQGVICIFPMVMQEAPLQVRIVEIYRDEAAYQAHIQTPHFLEYKSSTLKMIESLKLIEMDALDPEAMSLIFKKIK